MKHLSVWVGLATLALSSTPAYANSSIEGKPLTFYPLETSVSPTTEKDFTKQGFGAFSAERLNHPPNSLRSETEAGLEEALTSESSDHSFEFPRFQQPSNAGLNPSLADRLPLPPEAIDPPVSSSASRSIVPSTDTSPFSFPEGMKESDLFEAPQLPPPPPLAQPSPNQPDAAPKRSKIDKEDASSDHASSDDASSEGTLNEDPPSENLPSIDSPRSRPNPALQNRTRSGSNRLNAPSQNRLSRSAPPGSLPSASTKSVELDFGLPPAMTESPKEIPEMRPPVEPSIVMEAEPEMAQPIAPPKPDVANLKEASLDALFAGDENSLVAIAVGSAEGTRTPHGEKNPAYYGHTDPGNGVWNLGSFSYQHGANSPEEADAKQIARLRSQAETIQQKAATHGITLSLEEKLNGIDLANQAPKAVLDKAGYVEWLAESRARGMTGTDAILWARVQSFIDPSTKTWDAPGLGNSESRITRDQERRMLAIASAIQSYPHNIAQNASGREVALRTGNDDRAWFGSKRIAQLFAQPFTQVFSEVFSVNDRNESRASSSEAIGTQRILEIDLSDRVSAWSYP